MDLHQLQVAIFEKTGIRLDSSDPVFALVALNEVVVADLLATSREQWTQSNAELEAKLGALESIHQQILTAANELAGRVDQAHMAAALKAATEAKAEIFRAARDALHGEVEKSASAIMGDTAQLKAACKRSRSGSWAIAIVQSVIGGMVAAMIVLGVMLYK
ncbi:hypothetical protein ACI48D_08710 [Massilia sp. LXY-6]|uniref:hypothetical protein n=1 Tax=Massilia sp. LXY-6 TaxID=3379823 RepID=UPI003EE15674